MKTADIDTLLKEPWLPLMRELVWSYQAFSQYSSRQIKNMGLSPSQFDVIATLGNTDGMPFKELGEKTLITKGALTGIVDRMEKKGWVQRVNSSEDRRSTLARLTPQGQQLFEQVFPKHLAYLSEAFSHISDEDRTDAIKLLRILKTAF
jgi:DNA-binding MarR family transcriptional regulator